MVDGVPVVPQAVMTITQDGAGVPAVSEAVFLVTQAPPDTIGVLATQAVALVPNTGQGVSVVSQGSLLFTYRTGGVQNLTSRAWQFSLDGHTFYVLTLGGEGTFVYDTTTDQWARWKTAGLSTWNMELGVTWRGDVIAADQSNPTLWRLDPTTFIDDGFKTQTRVVTGGIAMRGRTFPQNYAFRVTASVGEPEVANTIPETLPTVQLSYSDDQGKTFVDREALEVSLGANIQELQWLSLGSMRPPQRVFRVTDVGAVVRIGGADAEVDGEEEG